MTLFVVVVVGVGQRCGGDNNDDCGDGGGFGGSGCGDGAICGGFSGGGGGGGDGIFSWCGGGGDWAIAGGICLVIVGFC